MDAQYGISLKNILAMDILSDAKLIAGKDGLNKTVTTVNIMVDPNIVDLVAGGDLLVSTTYSVRDQLSQLILLIPELKKRGVVGLGLKFNRTISGIPQDLIELCDQLAFPLFELPNNYSLSQIITPILTTIVNNQAKTLGDIYDLQKALTATMLNGGNLQSIAQALYDRFGNSVIIYNDFFSSFVLACREQNRESINRQMERLLRSSLLERDTAFLSSHKEVDNLNGLICNKIIIPIYSDKKKYGNIFIWEDNREFTSVDLAVLEASTSLIALDMIKKVSMYEMENNHKTSFLDDLLVHDEERQRKSLANAEYFDFDVDSEHQVAVIKVLNDLSGGSSLYKVNNTIVNLLRRACREASFKILFVNKCDSIVLIFESSSNNREEIHLQVKKFLEMIMQDFKDNDILSVISIGIGRFYKDALDLWKSFQEATRASSCITEGSGCVHYFDELGVYRFLSYEALQPELQIFYNETLRPLVEYDNGRDSELVRTLALYFESGGNLKKLAEKIGVHYNTVAYRIQRIRELGNVDFENAEQMLNLQIALKIHNVKQFR